MAPIGNLKTVPIGPVVLAVFAEEDDVTVAAVNRARGPTVALRTFTSIHLGWVHRVRSLPPSLLHEDPPKLGCPVQCRIIRRAPFPQHDCRSMPEEDLPTTVPLADEASDATTTRV
jgi:hypothetical protein